MNSQLTTDAIHSSASVLVLHINNVYSSANDNKCQQVPENTYVTDIHANRSLTSKASLFP
jgi:hypothetical protein